MKTKVNYEDLDRNILLYIWIWKLATQASLGIRFFKGRPMMTAYKYIHRMEKRKLIKMVPDNLGRSFAWGLTRKGFQSITHILPALKENGYASECAYHDLLVSSMLYEGILEKPRKHLTFISEQQLRRYESSSLPEWTPQMDMRVPDGYWLITSGTSKIITALEVELSIKNTTEYNFLGQLYGSNKSINRVMWMVRTNKQAIKLDQILNQKTFSAYSKHNFILERDYLSDFWLTEIIRGPERTKSLSQLLGLSKEKVMKKFSYSPMLDGRKFPAKLAGYKIYGEFKNRLCVDI